MVTNLETRRKNKRIFRLYVGSGEIARLVCQKNPKDPSWKIKEKMEDSSLAMEGVLGYEE